jgi:hypothetical protein
MSLQSYERTKNKTHRPAFVKVHCAKNGVRVGIKVARAQRAHRDDDVKRRCSLFARRVVNEQRVKLVCGGLFLRFRTRRTI